MAGTKPCPADKILNPATGRYVKRDGRIGKELIRRKKSPLNLKKRPKKQHKSGGMNSQDEEKSYILDNPDLWPIIRVNMSLEAYVNSLMVLKHPSIIRVIDLRRPNVSHDEIPVMFRPLFATQLDTKSVAVVSMIGKKDESFKYMLAFYGDTNRMTCVVLTIKASNDEQYVQLFAYLNGHVPETPSLPHIQWYTVVGHDKSRFDYVPVVEYIFDNILTYKGSQVLKDVFVKLRNSVYVSLFKYFVIHDFEVQNLPESEKICQVIKGDPTYIMCRNGQYGFEMRLDQNELVKHSRFFMHISEITNPFQRSYKLYHDPWRDYNVLRMLRNVYYTFDSYSHDTVTMTNEALNEIWAIVYSMYNTYLRDVLKKEGFKKFAEKAIRHLKQNVKKFNIDALYNELLNMNKTPFIFFLDYERQNYDA